MLLVDVVPWGGVGLKHVGNAYLIDLSEGVLQAKDLNYMPDDTMTFSCCAACKMTDHASTIFVAPHMAVPCLKNNHYMSIHADGIILIRNNNRRYLEGQKRVPARRVTRKCSVFQPTCSDDTEDALASSNELLRKQNEALVKALHTITEVGCIGEIGSGKCGPDFEHQMCPEHYPFCNEANGWCGNTDAHRDAQSSTTYDYDVACENRRSRRR